MTEYPVRLTTRINNPNCHFPYSRWFMNFFNNSRPMSDRLEARSYYVALHYELKNLLGRDIIVHSDGWQYTHLVSNDLAYAPYRYIRLTEEEAVVFLLKWG